MFDISKEVEKKKKNIVKWKKIYLNLIEPGSKAIIVKWKKRYLTAIEQGSKAWLKLIMTTKFAATLTFWHIVRDCVLIYEISLVSGSLGSYVWNVT